MKKIMLLAVITMFSFAAFAEGENLNDVHAGIICNEELNKSAVDLDKKKKKTDKTNVQVEG